MDVFTRNELDRLTSRDTLPGVDVNEVRCLREWIRREGSKYDELRFNVRVGRGVTLEGDFAEKFKADWERRTRMRLDLLGWNPPTDATIVEAKRQWTNDAVWQLLAYRDHYLDEFSEHTVRLVGVCEAYTPTARTLALDKGIKLHVYGFRDDLPQAPAAAESSS